MSVFVYSVIDHVCVKCFILQSELGTLALKYLLICLPLYVQISFLDTNEQRFYLFSVFNICCFREVFNDKPDWYLSTK
jgi:hypothetical protein